MIPSEFITIDYQRAEYFRYFFASVHQIRYIVCFQKRLCLDLLVQFDEPNYKIASQEISLDEAFEQEAVRVVSQEGGELEVYFRWKALGYTPKVYRVSPQAYQQLSEHLAWIVGVEEQQALQKLFETIFTEIK